MTQDELATLVLRYEGLYGSDETPSAEDLGDAKTIIEAEMASMTARGLNFWNTTDDSISTQHVMALVKRIGPVVGASYGKYSTPEATAAANQIERLELNQLSVSPPTGAVAQSEPF